MIVSLTGANLPQSLRGTEERLQRGESRIEGLKDGEGRVLVTAYRSEDGSDRHTTARVIPTTTHSRQSPFHACGVGLVWVGFFHASNDPNN